MKHLTIFRHAAAENDSRSGDDMDRALTPSGVHTAGAVALKLAKAVAEPGVILTSTAHRARQTAEIVCDGLGWNQSAITAKSVLYNAFDNDFLKIVSGISDSLSTAIVVGHNPSVSEVANRFCKGVTDGMSPADAILLDFEADSWSDVVFGAGILVLYVEARTV